MTISLIVVLTAVVMISVELAAPGRKWPSVAGWWARAAALNAVQVGSVFLIGRAWDGFLGRHRFFDLDGLGVTGGVLIGYLAVTFVYYWWHRARHHIGFLWRWFHQVHHSPQRIEVITSFYKHPFEIVANTFLSSAILFLGVGLGPEAASIVILFTGLAELFYHWNVKTPYWMGFLFQRPESHCVHHEENLHSFNYADIPLWDMMFGTFRNPKAWEKSCGFGDKEERLGMMLRGVDVNQEEARS